MVLNKKMVIRAGLCVLFSLWFFCSGHALLAADTVSSRAKASQARKHDTMTRPVREYRAVPLKPRGVREIPRFDLPLGGAGVAQDQSLSRTQASPALSPDDPALRDPAAAAGLLMPAAEAAFEGINNVAGVLPPDTCGDVGPSHYVQAVNLHFQVFAKNGTSLLGPLPINSLWGGFGGVCETLNNGDPIVLYDQWADRWLISQFALNYGGQGFHQCIAISTTGDPTGTWHRYDYFMSSNIMNDYPKFGVWPDGYYMSINQFNAASSYAFAGQGVVAFEREKMLAGQAAAMQYIDASTLGAGLMGMLPSDADGMLPPAPGEPNHFVMFQDNNRGAAQDQLVMYDFHVDWADPTNTSFAQAAGSPLATAPFVWYSGDVPQPGTTQLLDAIGDRLMYRLQYRNFGGDASMVVNHTVNSGGGIAGIRWYELRNGGSGWAIQQQGTYAGDTADGKHRWMGSIAMDHQGNMALGYSLANGTDTYPSIAYTGRMAGDPAGALPQGEMLLQAGGGSQTHSSGRWGDYSMMSVDPVDDCTFWYTQEYYQATSSAGWQTRVGSFRFPGCTAGPKGELSGEVRDITGNPLAGALLTVSDGGSINITTTSGPDGSYRFAALPEGIYSVTAAQYGYTDVQVSGVSIVDSTMTTQDFQLLLAAFFTLEGRVTDAATGLPLYARIDYGYGAVWSDPLTGQYSVDLPQDEYLLAVTSYVAGYEPVVRGIVLAAAMTEDFGLQHLVTCEAPGYSWFYPGEVLGERFDTCSLPAGWSVNNLGGSCSWTFDNPGQQPNLTGGTGCFAIADSDFCGTGTTMNTELVSPQVDCSALAQVHLEFKYDVYRYYSTTKFAVDVSTDGGGNWMNVWQRVGVNDRGPRTAVIDISALAAGQGDVRVRFLYSAPGWDWWWQVDDVVISEGTPQCTAPVDGGYVFGRVLDANSGSGLNNALVQDGLGIGATTMATSDVNRPDGFYTLFLSTAGSVELTASQAAPPGYGQDQHMVTVPTLGNVQQDFSLPAGKLAAVPESVEVVVPPGGTKGRDIDLVNSGGRDAAYQLMEREGPFPLRPNGPFTDKIRHMSPKDMDQPDARTARYEYPDPGVPQLATAGDVLRTWDSGLIAPWAVAFDTGLNKVWLGNIALGGGDNMDHEFATNGAATGRAIDVSKIPQSFMADFAYDTINKTMWQVNVGGDNCIHELDPAALTVTGGKICPAFGVSQRGLAYNQKTDTFYAGSWNDSTIYEFDRSGAMLRLVNVGLPIAGLAFNPATDHLFVMNSTTSVFPLTVLDVLDNFRPRFGIAVQGFSGYGGAGLDMDCEGNLWALDQATGKVFVISSGEANGCSGADIPWLVETPGSSSVSAGNAAQVHLDFTAVGLAAGETRQGYLIVETDTPYSSGYVPVTMRVMALPLISATTYSEVTRKSVRMEAQVNPQCQTTEYYFEYGSSPGVFDQRTSSIFSSSCEPIRISALLEGLRTGTTYYIRLVAVNAAGTSYSSVIAVTTEAFPWFLFIPAISAQFSQTSELLLK